MNNMIKKRLQRDAKGREKDNKQKKTAVSLKFELPGEDYGNLVDTNLDVAVHGIDESIALMKLVYFAYLKIIKAFFQRIHSVPWRFARW